MAGCARGRIEQAMLRFIGRRLLFIVLVSVLIVFFAQLGMNMARNSEGARSDLSLVRQSRAAWAETRSFLAGVLRGDLGSVRTPRGLVPVTEILGESYANSMGLLLAALVVSAGVGVTTGGVVALARREAITLPLLALTILGISTPSFFAGLLLQLGELRYLATFGRRLVSIAGSGWDLQHMLMPVAVLAARPVAYLARTTYLALERTMSEDYIRTARAKGAPLGRIVSPHALRNVAIPILTAVGVSLRFSLSTLPVVEFFFAWPGIGRRLLESIDARQDSVVIALASMLGLTLLLTNLLLDIAYRIADPRIRDSS
jgi:peptide/nickel transport system permease protein